MSPQNQKGKPCEMDLPLFKNDIPNNLEPQQPVIYRYYAGFCRFFWYNKVKAKGGDDEK